MQILSKPASRVANPSGQPSSPANVSPYVSHCRQGLVFVSSSNTTLSEDGRNEGRAGAARTKDILKKTVLSSPDHRP